MARFVADHADCFHTKSANSSALASRYVSGLLSQTQRKNIERMEERLGTDEALGKDSYQAVQPFVSSSPWDHNAVYERIARRANERLGGSADRVLALDECCVAKKGGCICWRG